jgi:hypothetical protein
LIVGDECVGESAGKAECLCPAEGRITTRGVGTKQRVVDRERCLEAALLDERARAAQVIRLARAALLLLGEGSRGCGDEQGENRPTEFRGHIRRRSSRPAVNPR